MRGRVLRWLPVSLVLFIPLYIQLVSRVRPIVQTIWTADTLMLADFGLRWLEGLAPHADYFSGLGVFTSAIFAAGLWFDNLDISGVFFAIECVACLAAGGLLVLGVTLRLPAYVSVLIAYLVLEYSLSLRVLGFHPSYVALAGYYNRVGWDGLAALFVLTLSLTVDPRGRGRATLAGIVLSFVLAVKTNFAAAGVVLIAPLALGGPAARAALARALGAFAVTTLLWIYGCGIGLAAFLRDQRTILNAMPLPTKIENLTRRLEVNRVEFAITALFILACLVPSARARAWPAVKRTLALYLGTFGATLLAGVGTMSYREFLLSLLSPLCALALLKPGQRSRRPWAAAALVAALAWPTIRDNFASYRYQREQVARVRNPDWYQTIDSPHLKDVYFGTWDGQVGVAAMDRVARERKIEPSPASYVRQWNHGLALLKAHAQPHRALLTLNWDQSMSYLADMTHVRGDALLYHINRLNSVPLPTDVEGVVKRADYALTPRFVPDWGDTVVTGIFFPFVQKHMRVIAETEDWKLWER